MDYDRHHQADSQPLSAAHRRINRVVHRLYDCPNSLASSNSLVNSNCSKNCPQSSRSVQAQLLNSVNIVNTFRNPLKPTNLNRPNNRLTTLNGFSIARFVHFLFILLLLFTNHGSQAQNLTLVTSALRTFQTHACDGQLLHLNCKPNTVISILFAQYGFANNQICSSNSTLSNEDKPRNCTESLRYSLLKKVESTCREKSACTIDSSTRSLGVTDQCPNTAKYAEVAYRCRPDTFQNKFACAEKSLDLSCPSRQRILIYAASFGTAVRTPPECANNTIPAQLLRPLQTNFIKKPFKEYCQAKQVTRTVADRCHTQGNCSVRAAFDQFPFVADCELNNDERQTQVHLKVTFACVQNEVLRTNLVGSSSGQQHQQNNNQLSNQLGNMIANIGGSLERSKGRVLPNRTATSSSASPNEPTSTPASTVQQPNGKPEFTDLLDSNLLPASEFNGNSKLFDPETAVHPTDSLDNLPAAVRSNEQQAAWPGQLGELPTDFKTHISHPNQPKSIEPFRDWNSFCQYIENNLERLLIYLLVALCVALAFCFVFLGLSHLSERKTKSKQQRPCASLECSVQEDCCDPTKPDLASSLNLGKTERGLSVYANFESDNPSVDEIIADHRNGSYIGISQQLTSQLNAQLAQHCKTMPNQMLFTDSSGADLLNCHQFNNQLNNQLNSQLSNQINNRLASTFSPTHHHYNYNGVDYATEKYDFQNAMYPNDTGSPAKIAVPQSASFYNMQTYTPIYTSPANQTIVGAAYQQAAIPQQTAVQQTQTTFQQLQPAQLLISSQQSDNENGSTTTTMTTIGSQTDSSTSSTDQMAGNSANGLLHGNQCGGGGGGQMHHAPLYNTVHNHQINSISPSNFNNPVTLQILTTPQHLNDVQLTEAAVFQPM